MTVAPLSHLVTTRFDPYAATKSFHAASIASFVLGIVLPIISQNSEKFGFSKNISWYIERFLGFVSARRWIFLFLL